MKKAWYLVYGAAVFASATAIASVTPPQPGATRCEFGTVYESTKSGTAILVMRIGSGSNSFQADGSGPKQQGVALDFFLTDSGERGAIYGPMRSYMFATDLDTLTQLGYRWKNAEPDPDGFFRVLSDDGQNELFTLTYVGCAPNREN